MAFTPIKDSEFKEKVIDSKLPVLVDFWAPWCGPCKLAEPVIEELATDYAGKIVFHKMNVDEEQVHAGELGVMSIPTTILFKDGKEVGRQIGFAGKKGFEDLLQKA